jgi:hypothetical protein
MNNIQRYCIFALGLLVLGFLTFLAWHHSFSVRPGQVWVWEYKTPYDHLIHTNKVLDVRDGWVLYTNEFGLRSHTISYFLVGSRKLKAKQD